MNTDWQKISSSTNYIPVDPKPAHSDSYSQSIQYNQPGGARSPKK